MPSHVEARCNARDGRTGSGRRLADNYAGWHEVLICPRARLRDFVTLLPLDEAMDWGRGALGKSTHDAAEPRARPGLLERKPFQEGGDGP